MAPETGQSDLIALLIYPDQKKIILRLSPELLDVEMLFHPFKELMQILISSLKYLNFHYICTCETAISETAVSQLNLMP